MLENIDEIIHNAESSMAIEELDLDFIIESIREQILDLMESSSKKNYLKSFEKNIEESELNEEEKNVIRNSVYNEIINIITEKFNIEIDRNEISNKELAKNLYKFFIIDYVKNVEQFLEIYIIENKKSIVDELERKDINSKRIEGISSKKMAIILNNISFVIEIIASSNITFKEFLELINRHPESTSSSGELLEYMDDIIEYADDIMTYIMDLLINEEEGFGNIYTELQRNLFERFNTIN